MIAFLLSMLPIILLVLVMRAAWNQHWQQDRRCYPMRPMDNRERRALWAVKRYLNEPAMPNTFFNFPIRKHGTGLTNGATQ